MRNLLGLLGVLVWAIAAPAAEVPELVKKLGSSDNEVRRAAAKDLSDLGKDAKAAIKPLVKALKDEDRFVRRFAAQALGNIGPDAKTAIPALSELIGDDRPQVREAAVKALGKMGDAGVPALAKALSGTPSDVQDLAIDALGEAGKAGVAPLLSVLKDDSADASLRRRALAAVVPHPTLAQPAIPSLVEIVKNPRVRGQDGRQLRLEAVQALGRLAKKSDTTVVKTLETIAQDEKLMDNQLKNTCKQTLKKLQSPK